MPAITLPDGSVRRFDAPVTGTALAAAIGPGLARAALAMKVDGELADLSRPIEHDAACVFVTRRDPDALGDDPPRRRARAGRGGAGAVSRHAGHDRAVDRERLLLRFRPQRAVHAGGFRRRSRRKMREIVARNAPFEREVWDRDEAIALLRGSAASATRPS